MPARLKITRKDKLLNHQTFFRLLDEFIKDTSTGKRHKKNGARIAMSTVDSYIYFRTLMQDFVEQTSFEMKLHVVNNLTQRELEQAANYWRKFYKAFTDFMYNKKGYYDNFVGHSIKRFRVFLNYLNNERNINVGNFHKSFFVPKEDIDIITVNPEQFNYIIFDEDFNQRVHEQGLQQVKDIFVFGCTVALRVSDLMTLTRKNLVVQQGNYYLNVKSQKTKTKTSIKLPDYAVDVIERYKGQYRTLLPSYSRAHLDKQLKKLGKLLPDDYEVVKTREKRGKAVIIYKDQKKKEHYKLSDHITTHTMRRTAITNMLNLGMPEYMVRKISGHAANSREFFKYVELMQSSMDRETEQFFQKIVDSGDKNGSKKGAFLT